MSTPFVNSLRASSVFPSRRNSFAFSLAASRSFLRLASVAAFAGRFLKYTELSPGSLKNSQLPSIEDHDRRNVERKQHIYILHTEIDVRCRLDAFDQLVCARIRTFVQQPVAIDGHTTSSKLLDHCLSRRSLAEGNKTGDSHVKAFVSSSEYFLNVYNFLAGNYHWCGLFEDKLQGDYASITSVCRSCVGGRQPIQPNQL